jgi:hypothetical protein
MKITPAQFQLMLNKKWKNSAHFLDLCVAMFAGNCKLLQSDNLFKQLQLGHKDVVIKIDHEKNTGYMEKNLKKTIIKLAGQKKDEVHDVGCNSLHLSQPGKGPILACSDYIAVNRHFLTMV